MEDILKNPKTKGLIAIFATLFLNFIGTFIARKVLADDEKAVKHTILHLLSMLLVIIPIIGFIAYLAINVYYIISNYNVAAKEEVAEDEK
jgi:ABC-type molybdate transport system permease subunit